MRRGYHQDDSRRYISHSRHTPCAGPPYCTIKIISTLLFMRIGVYGLFSEIRVNHLLTQHSSRLLQCLQTQHLNFSLVQLVLFVMWSTGFSGRYRGSVIIYAARNSLVFLAIHHCRRGHLLTLGTGSDAVASPGRRGHAVTSRWHRRTEKKITKCSNVKEQDEWKLLKLRQTWDVWSVCTR